MKFDQIKSRFGKETVREHIELLPKELENDDGVGLHTIIPSGTRTFYIEGAELEEFTRRAARSLLDAGAVLLKSPYGDDPWAPELRYGERHDEIIDNVVDVWLADAAEEPDAFAVWFGLPRNHGNEG